MDLTGPYSIVTHSVVAIAVKSSQNRPSNSVPKIIGTGFVVGEGLVATNDHVVRAAQAVQTNGLPQSGWPLAAVLFFLIPDKGMCQVQTEILGCFVVDSFKPQGYYYGPEKPDLGFFHVNMQGLRPLRVCESLEKVGLGTPVATVGFPMGTSALCAPGYVHQLMPTLQQGIVSAVLPFPCKAPHALMLNFMSLGGASGSPVFLPDSADVVGVLYGGLQETYMARVQGVDVPYKVPTNFSYCVAGHFLQRSIEEIARNPAMRLPEDSPHLDDALSQVRALEIPAYPSDESCGQGSSR
jgi:hypothetical protein